MKKLIILLIAISPVAYGQKIDYNKIILPRSAQNIDLGERLVQIAWENNPNNKIVLQEKNVAKESLRLARWSWLDNIYGVYNYNEYTNSGAKTNVNPDPNAQNIIYPKYNLGVRLSLGDLVSIPLRTKRAKEEVFIAEESINARKVELRSQVLVAYQNYLMTRELYRIQTEVTEDANAAFSLTENKFKDGDLTFEEYNEGLQAFNAERVRKITAENAYQLSKIRLEEIVGVRMEDIE
ncbi:MAG TPA: TolC family protein [Cytophagales bacterium]|nr:TolC family protein [Cytophagales bacterium]